MKRVFVSLSFMLAVGLTTAFADNHTDVNSKIKQSFDKEFTEAKLISWDEAGSYQIARFILHAHAAIAYFNEDGELLGCARSILFNELPMAAIKSFEEKYTGGYFTEIAEILNSEGTFYSATVTTINKSYHIKADANGSILKRTRIK